MLNRVLGDYGAPFTDKFPVEDPESEIASSEFNQLAEDMAEASRVVPKIILHFPTISSVANTMPSYTETQWGSGASYYPTTVTRTATGAYTITYPATFATGLAVDESVTFNGATGSVQSASVYGHVQCSASGGVISVKVFDAAGAAVDITNGTTIRIEAR